MFRNLIRGSTVLRRNRNVIQQVRFSSKDPTSSASSTIVVAASVLAVAGVLSNGFRGPGTPVKQLPRTEKEPVPLSLADVLDNTREVAVEDITDTVAEAGLQPIDANIVDEVSDKPLIADETFDAIVETLGDIPDYVEETVIEKVAEFIDNVDAIVEAVEDVVDENVHESIEGVEAAAGAFVEAVEIFIDPIVEALEEVEDSIRVVDENVSDSIEVVEAAAEAFVEAMEQVKDIVDENISNSTEGIEAAVEAVEKVKDSVEKIVEAIVEAVEEVKDSIEDVADQNVSESIEGVEGAAEAFVEAIEQVRDSMDEIVDGNVFDIVEDVEAVVEAVMETLEDAAIEKVLENVELINEVVVEAIEEIKESVEENLETLVETAVSENVEVVTEAIEEFAGAVIDHTLETVESVIALATAEEDSAPATETEILVVEEAIQVPKEPAPVTQELVLATDELVPVELPIEKVVPLIEEVVSVTEETVPVIEETVSVTEETFAVIEETVPVIEEVIPVTEESVPVIEEVIPVTEETVPVIEEVIPVTEETVPVIEEVIPVTEETVPVIEEVVSVTEETVPVIEEVIPVTEETVPVIEEVIPVTEETVPVIEEVVSVTEEILPVIEETVSVIVETVSVTEETVPVIEETASVTEETIAVIEETLPVIEEVVPVTEETDPVLDVTVSVTEETVPVIEDTVSVTEETVSVIEEGPPVIEEVAPVTEEAVPVIEEVLPVTEETVPALEVTIPVIEDTVSATEETVAVIEETLPVIEEVVAVTEETVPVIEEVIPVTEETVPVLEVTVSLTEETVPVIEDTISVTEETVAVIEESVSVADEPVIVTEETVLVTDSTISVADEVIEKVVNITEESVPMELDALPIMAEGTAVVEVSEGVPTIEETIPLTDNVPPITDEAVLPVVLQEEITLTEPAIVELAVNVSPLPTAGTLSAVSTGESEKVPLTNEASEVVTENINLAEVSNNAVVGSADNASEEIIHLEGPESTNIFDYIENIPKEYPEVPEEVPYLIVGGGTAAYAAVRAIRKYHPEAKILIVSKEDQAPYNRTPLSKEMWFTTPGNVLMAKYDDWRGKEKSIFHEKYDFYCTTKELQSRTDYGGTSLLLGAEIDRLNPCKKIAFLTNGSEIKYDKCLVAIGGEPKGLPVFDNAGDSVNQNVTLFRNLKDFWKLEDISRRSGDIVIVGSGFLGTELAYALGERSREVADLKVTQICRESGVLGAVLPRHLSEYASTAVEDSGVKVIRNAEIESVTKDEKININLNDGRQVEADHVVLAVGVDIDPNFAKKSGLEYDQHRGGLIVNSELESRRDIYVAGDAANFYDIRLGRRRVEHYDHAVVTGRLAGENMTGKRKAYSHQSMFWSDIGANIGFEAMGLVDSRLKSVSVFADNHAEAINIVENDQVSRNKYDKGVVFYLRNEIVVGVVTWNIFGKMGVARRLIALESNENDFVELAKVFNVHKS